jgi:two-component system sensor histidine kinase KdpD
LRTVTGQVGVLVVLPPRNAQLGLAQRQMLETLGAQLALVIEQTRLKEETTRTRVEEHSRHLQKTLLDSVSHEFKTPLAVIAAVTQRLSEQSPSPLLDEIRSSISRLERIVGNLLDITRIETGTVRPQPVWCDLHEIVDVAMSRVADEIAARTVERVIPDAAATLRVDAALLEEILVNLLRNAAQHSAPASTILVVVSKEDAGVVVSVADEGSGLEGETAGRLFEKFERGPDAKAGGLGLGLSIVRGFSEALGGSVAGGPRRDGRTGAEFRVALPVATKPLPELEGRG